MRPRCEAGSALRQYGQTVERRGCRLASHLARVPSHHAACDIVKLVGPRRQVHLLGLDVGEVLSVGSSVEPVHKRTQHTTGRSW